MTNKRKRNDKTSPKWWHCHLDHILRWRIVHLIREEIKARSFRLRTIHQHIKRLLGWRYVLIAGSHGYKLKEVTKKEKEKEWLLHNAASKSYYHAIEVWDGMECHHLMENNRSLAQTRIFGLASSYTFSLSFSSHLPPLHFGQ